MTDVPTSARPPAWPYLEWWGLAEAPFQLEPDARFAYERADHREGLARLLFGLTHLGGIVAITGEIGCGKTTLVRALEHTLTGHGFTIFGVANPPRTASGVLASLLASAGSSARGGGAAKLAARLRERLAAEAERGRRAVVVIDEAQRLDTGGLEELRLLTNPGDGPAAPVVLLGQPELSATIRRLPQLDQRIVVRYHLGAMGADEATAYIRHRCRVAGATRNLFTPRAEAAVHAATGGIPRVVNLLCANALFVGFVQREPQIGEDLVRDLADDRAGEAGEVA
jgi:general secretion pathway protein A